MRSVILAVLLSSVTAHADHKDPTVALGLSAGTTLAGIGALAVGVATDSVPVMITGAAIAFVGPTVGHIYAGDGWNNGLAVRLGSGALLLVGAELSLTCMDECHGQGGDGPLSVAGKTVAALSGTVYLGAMFYEISSTRGAADTYNREHDVHVSLVPTGNGLALAGTF